MAKGVRNKQRKKNEKIRREIFLSRHTEKQDQITPDLEKLRQNNQARRESDLKAAESASNENSMDDSTPVNSTRQPVIASDYDKKSMKNKDGNYAPWLTGKEVKNLKKINNKKKTQAKNKKRQASKKVKNLANTVAGRKAIEDLKQQKLDEAMA